MSLPPKSFTGTRTRPLKPRRIFWDASLSMAVIDADQALIQLTFLDGDDRPHRVSLTQDEAEYLANRLRSYVAIARQHDVSAQASAQRRPVPPFRLDT